MTSQPGSRCARERFERVDIGPTYERIAALLHAAVSRLAWSMAMDNNTTARPTSRVSKKIVAVLFAVSLDSRRWRCLWLGGRSVRFTPRVVLRLTTFVVAASGAAHSSIRRRQPMPRNIGVDGSGKTSRCERCANSREADHRFGPRVPIRRRSHREDRAQAASGHVDSSVRNGRLLPRSDRCRPLLFVIGAR